MPLIVERASYSTKNWETIHTLLPTSEMRHIVDHSNPQGLTRYVFGYSPQEVPILARVLGGVIEEMYIIEPGNNYIVGVKRTPSSSERSIRFRLVD